MGEHATSGEHCIICLTYMHTSPADILYRSIRYYSSAGKGQKRYSIKDHQFGFWENPYSYLYNINQYFIIQYD